MIHQTRMLLNAVTILAVMGIPVANADDTYCPNSLGSVTVDNVIVIPGSRCTLNGTRVDGNVKVEEGGDLRTRNGTYIGGNVQADYAERVFILRGTYVGGNVQIKNTQDEKGNLPTTRVVRSMIGGDVQLEDNKGGIRVRRNMIGGNLQCFGNYPPIQVSNNMVDGDTEGQCYP